MSKENGEAHADRAHCLFGGSNATQWVNCPASAVYRSHMPPKPTSDAAAEGTRAHEAAEVVLHDFIAHRRDGTDPDIRAHLTFSLDEEMQEAVRGYRDTIWEKVLNHSVTQKAYGFEEKFMLSKELDIGGPCDFWCVGLDDRGRRYGYIVDFKYGYVEVQAHQNLQLALYACGLLKEIRSMGKDLDYVNAAIYQPRCQGDPFKTTTFTATQLDRYTKKFLKAAQAVLLTGNKTPKHKVGDWCVYCAAQPICPAYQKTIDEKMAVKLIDAREDIKRVPRPEEVPDETLVKIILADDEITTFLKECRSYALSRAMSGKPLPGLKVVKTKTRRKWHDQQDEVAKVLAAHGVQDPYNQKLKSISDIERQLKKLHSTKKAEEIMEPLCVETRATDVLVPVSDPRPAISSYDDLLGVEDVKL